MATQLPLDKAIIRIQDNDARFNTFVNGNESEFFTTGNQEVPSIQKFLSKKNIEIDGMINSNIKQIIDTSFVKIVDEVIAHAPTINFIGEFSKEPTVGENKKNSVYKNTSNNNTYITSGTPLTWGLFLESGVTWDIKVESSNGTAFRLGRFSHTMLIAHVFRNGIDVTDMIQDSRFRWRRVSYVEQSVPYDDATWNLSYSSGYKQILVSVDEILAKATFHCDIFDS